MNLQEKENLYLLAKQRYYEGNPIISDFEFDTLEEDLKFHNSQVVRIVGSANLKDAKFNHASPMLSLTKIQVLRGKPLPISEFDHWFKTNSPKGSESTYLESSPKFDGSSCNLIYNEGKIEWALTRGDKEKGQNILDKMKFIIPSKIDMMGKVEIRGEVVIPTKTFDAKYAHIYKNPRNFVAGILGRDEINEEIMKDFHFIAFETRVHEKSSYYHHPQTQQFLRYNNFITSPFIQKFNSNGFEEAYEKMLHFREKESPYQLDGFVIKFSESLREFIGETDHHPKWAIAIKFPPKEAIAKIRTLSWNLGVSGEFNPIAVLEPIDLDGTTVTNVNVHNYGNVIKQGLFPGAEVIIVKSGDIIPIVQKVIKPASSKIEDYIPTQCSTSDCKIEVEGEIHLVCNNPNCRIKKINRLGHGIGAFALRNIAGSTINKLFNAGYETILDIFNNQKFNEERLIKSLEFKKGRQLDIIIESRNNPTRKITMQLVIASLSFDNVGWTTAGQIAKIFEEEEPNWSGLSYAAYKPFLDKTSEEYQLVLQFIKVLNENGFKIHSNERKKITEDSIICEFTGSPKEFGFKTKEDYLDKIKVYGYIHGNLDKNCKYLVTDDINSSSSKMIKAKKLGIEIITYSDLIKKLSI